MSIGDRITQLRSQRNMSQNQLAQAMGVSRQAVSKWENGLTTPDATKMILLADVLDTDLEYLTTGRQVVPSRPPVVLTEVQTVEVNVEKIVEKPVIHVVEKLVEQKVEIPVVKRVIRTRYLRNPVEFALVAIGAFALGIWIGLLF
ncbi:MAG: helix-turn-helix transcriptional regulator [Oscillospiraceae bacterium]|nr:helix-turn-helix transcriptional regulator [Oscillospiraceae bacterium]